MASLMLLCLKRGAGFWLERAVISGAKPKMLEDGIKKSSLHCLELYEAQRRSIKGASTKQSKILPGYIRRQQSYGSAV